MTPTALVLFTVFIDLIGFGIVLPLLPSYASQFHASDAAIGLMVASFSLMQFLLAPGWGRLSDRIGRRPVLLVGLAGSALSYLLFAVANGYWTLLVSRMVAGAMGATVNVAQAYLADTSTAENRARSMGLLGAAFGLGFVLGPAIGGLSSRFGLAAPGLIATALTATNFVLAWRLLPESRPTATHRPERAAPVHWTRFLMGFAAMACTTAAFTVLYVVFPLELERRLGYARHQSAYFFVLIGLVSAAVQGGLTGRLVARFGERRLIGAGGLILAGGFMLLLPGFAGGPASLALLCLGLVAVSIGSATISPSAVALVSRTAPAEEQGRALGLLQGVGAVARIIGPIMSGAIAGRWGAGAAFGTASVVAGLVTVAAVVGARE